MIAARLRLLRSHLGNGRKLGAGCLTCELRGRGAMHVSRELRLRHAMHPTDRKHQKKSSMFRWIPFTGLWGGWHYPHAESTRPPRATSGIAVTTPHRNALTGMSSNSMISECLLISTSTWGGNDGRAPDRGRAAPCDRRGGPGAVLAERVPRHHDKRDR